LTVYEMFLCCYDICAHYTVGVEGTPGRGPQYSDNAERITTVDVYCLRSIPVTGLRL